RNLPKCILFGPNSKKGAFKEQYEKLRLTKHSGRLFCVGVLNNCITAHVEI
ncbi:30015_t:CDS:1, partial [Racocetra persica]